MIIPVHVQWELDPTQLPYQQWFSTTGLRQQITNENTSTGQASEGRVANGCEPSSTTHQSGLSKAFTSSTGSASSNSYTSSTSINEHEVRLYIASHHPEQWDTIGSIWLPDDDSLDRVEQGSRFWLWEEEMLAVVTVIEYRMEGLTYPSWRCAAGDWNREAASLFRQNKPPVMVTGRLVFCCSHCCTRVTGSLDLACIPNVYT